MSATLDLDARLPWPHYREEWAQRETLVWGDPDVAAESNYTDRLNDLDHAAYERGIERAQRFEASTPRYWLEFLRGYYKRKDVELVSVACGANLSNGYPYWALGYRFGAVAVRS